MGLDYDTEALKADLFAVLEDHAEWFNKLSLNLFYPFDVRADQSIVKPVSFAQWLVGVQKQDGVVQGDLLDKLSSLHSELFQASQRLQNHVTKTQAKPDYKDYASFVTLYEEFAANMRRLERDILADGNGYDCVTGLRLAKLYEKDVNRELDRLARQGRSFCLALVRVDYFADISANASGNEMVGYVRLLADLVKLSLRSYDDAYYLGDGEYLLSLKQSDVSGGISALERLRKELERQGIMVNTGGASDVLMSMSCVIVEPVAGDKPQNLVQNLREDLNSKEHVKTDTVLKYHELSPLQKYVQGVDGSASH